VKRALVLLVALLAGCDYPMDTGTTLADVRESGVIRAGISANPPWTTVEGGRPGGTEAATVERFAQRLHARVEWHPGSESALMEAAHERELDVVVAGLTKDSLWVDKVALTKGAQVWAVPPGENAWQVQVEDFLMEKS
jgi:polar amino acid transport system substrate-binding protein